MSLKKIVLEQAQIILEAVAATASGKMTSIGAITKIAIAASKLQGAAEMALEDSAVASASLFTQLNNESKLQAQARQQVLQAKNQASYEEDCETQTAVCVGGNANGDFAPVYPGNRPGAMCVVSGSRYFLNEGRTAWEWDGVENQPT